jgi:hypothetical protein
MLPFVDHKTCLMSAAVTVSVVAFALKLFRVIVYVPGSTARTIDDPLSVLVISNGILF